MGYSECVSSRKSIAKKVLLDDIKAVYMRLNLHRHGNICFSILTIVTLNCFADSEELGKFYGLSLEELGKVKITSATGNSTPVNSAPSTASVITAAQIETMGVKNLDEILETVPGLHVSISSLNRLDSIYSIRGIHTGFNPHVLLLLNGVPVQFSLQGGRPALLRLPVTAIQQIEVIRGPGSAVYGADAYAGVINVITKSASYTGALSSGLSTGSFGYRELWTQLRGNFGDWDAIFSTTFQTSNGDSSRIAESDLQTLFDQIFMTNASLAPSYLSTRYNILDTHLNLANNHWSANLWYWRSNDAGIGAGAAQALDQSGSDDSKLLLTDVTYKTQDWIESWENSVRFSYLYYDLQAQFNLLPPGTVVPIGSDGNLNLTSPAGIVAFPDGLIGNPGAKTWDTQWDLISVFHGWNNHRLRVAFGSRHQDLETRESKNFGPGVIDGSETVVDGTLTNVSNTPFVFAKNTSRLTRYISIQDEWDVWQNWKLTSGVRYDHYSDFGSTTNPRVALVWSTNAKITMKILYGSAFRAPSFSEQFNENNPVSIGSPDLEPESIDTQELSLNAQLSASFATSINLFTYQAKDMIEFVPDAEQTTNTATNSRDQRGRGFEWEFHWKASSNFNTSGSYSWQKSENESTNMRVPDAPKNQLSLMVNWEIASQTFLHSRFNWVGERGRAIGDTRPALKADKTLDISLKRSDIFGKLGLAFTLKNALDDDAFEPSSGAIPGDYRLEKRSFLAEVTYRH